MGGAVVIYAYSSQVRLMEKRKEEGGESRCIYLL